MSLPRVSGWRAAVGTMFRAVSGEESLNIGLFSTETVVLLKNWNGRLS